MIGVQDFDLVNRESVLPLAREGKLTLRFDSEVVALEAVGSKVRVQFARPAGIRINVDRIVCALGGTTPQELLEVGGDRVGRWLAHLTRFFGTSVPGHDLACNLTAGTKGGSIILAFNTAAAAMRRIL